MTHPSLAGSRVVLVNAGSITSHVIALLASAGVEMLRIVDTTEVTVPDITGSPFLQREDIGHPRAESLARRLRARAPQVQCDAVQPPAYTTALLQPVLDGASFAMVCLEAPAPALLTAINQAALAADLPWIMAQTDGDTGYVGPTIIPHQTPCYQCVELRRTANRPDLSPAAATDGQGLVRGFAPVTPPLLASVGALAALDAMRMLTRIAVPQTAGRILRLDLLSTEITYHRVLRFPHCPACGYGDTRPLLERWQRPLEEDVR